MQVRFFLEQNRVPFQVLEHQETYDAQRMAAVLHVPGREVAKTVLLRGEDGSLYVVAVLPANTVIDLEKASKALGGTPLTLATEQEIAEHCPDCEVGVLPPFGSQYGMKTLMDSYLLNDDWIYFEGNTHHETVRMKLADFRRLEQPLIAPFARALRGQQLGV